VHTVGSLQRGNAGGTVALTNPNGSVSLTLKGPQQPDFSKLPYQFRYQITGGSGDFAGARGTGTALLGLGSIGVRHPPNMAPHGSYDLTILGDLPR